MINVAVIFGGKSVEHEVSVITGLQALHALDKSRYNPIPLYITKDERFFTGENLKQIESFRDLNKALQEATQVVPAREGKQCLLRSAKTGLFGNKEVARIDAALVAVHGTNVEDGTLQGYLEYLGIPYTGCDVTASALGMDKWAMKAVFQAAGIPVLPARLIRRAPWFEDTQGLLDMLEADIGYPIIVKPYNLGSSVGINKARNRMELENAVTEALSYSPAAICERAIQQLREINCSVLGDDDEAIPSVCEEPLNATDFLTYKDKYQANSGGKTGAKGSKGSGMANLSRAIPAPLSDEDTKTVQDIAVRAFHAIGAAGVSRCDIMMDVEENKFYMNEINTIPGSLSFYLWQPTGVDFTELTHRMLQIALKRWRQKQQLTFSFDTNLLQTASIGGGSGAKGAKG